MLLSNDFTSEQVLGSLQYVRRTKVMPDFQDTPLCSESPQPLNCG